MPARLRCAASLAILLACGCRGPGPAPAPKTLRAAVRADVTGFFPNPPAANESYTFEMNRWVVDAVVALDRGLNVIPALAQSWLTPDDRTFVLELHPGLRFADGRPVTAQDAAESLKAGIRLTWPNMGYLSTIESIQVLDERRLQVRSVRPDPTLLARLAWGFVLPADTVNRTPVPLVGTGPYTLEQWSPGQAFTFRRNPHYWGPTVPFEKAEFRIVADDASRLKLVETGEADLADFVPPEAWERLQANPALRVEVGRGHRVLFLGLRVDRPPFDDQRVREALDLALDRPALVERVMLGKGSPANQLLPRGAVGHVPELPPKPIDRDRARALLLSAGLRPGYALRLDGPSNRYVKDVAIMHEVARQLAEVGLQVEVNPLEKRAFYRMLSEGRSLVHLLGWAAESGDGADAFEVLFPHPNRSHGGNWNASGFVDLRLTEMTQDAESTTNLRARAGILRRAYARLTELRPILPLVVQPEAVVYNPRRIRWDPPVSLALRPGDLRPAEGQAP